MSFFERMILLTSESSANSLVVGETFSGMAVDG